MHRLTIRPYLRPRPSFRPRNLRLQKRTGSVDRTEQRHHTEANTLAEGRHKGSRAAVKSRLCKIAECVIAGDAELCPNSASIVVFCTHFCIQIRLTRKALTVFLCLPHDLLVPLSHSHNTRLKGKNTGMSRQVMVHTLTSLLCWPKRSCRVLIQETTHLNDLQKANRNLE
jgi:hypothetical protein